MKTFRLLLLAIGLFAGQLALATNYTWNGGTSSDWGTATNWTPNGVPGASDNVTIVSAGTAPVYDGGAGVSAFNMYSGSLDLNGYTLSISGQGYFSGGTVNNGVIDANGTITYFFGGVLNAKVDVNSAKPYLNGATFNDSLIFEVTGNGAQSNGGNVFNGPVIMTNSGAYSPYYGHLNPDTFNNHLHIYNTGTGALTLANASDGHYFSDSVFVNCTSGQGIYFGNSGVEYEMEGPLMVGSSGFSVGTLKLRDFNQPNSNDFDLTLTGTAKIELNDGEFDGDMTLTVPYIDITHTTFNGKFDLTRSGTSNNNIAGGNLFNDTVMVSNTGNNMIMAITYPDTFNALTVLRNEGSGGLTIGYGTAGNEFNADLKVYNLTSSSGLSFQPFGSSGTTTFSGNVYVNSKSTGGVGFGPGNTPMLTMTSGYTVAVGDTGFVAGTLTIRRFEQEGPNPINLTLTAAANLKIEESEIGGDITYDGPGFIIDDAIFYGRSYFTRDTTANEELLGSSTYYGDASFTNDGSGNLMWRTSDTYYGDVSFIANSTGDLKPGNYSTNTFKGDIYVNDPSEVSFGLDYAGSKVVLDGDDVQTISSGSSGTIAFRDLETNKSQGYIEIQEDLSILDSLILTDGIIYTDTFLIEVKNDAEAVGAADTSHVDGRVKKTGNDAFTYPIGKNGHYRPIGISAPSSTTAEFVGEYFESNSDWLYDHSSKDASIDEISRNEYWDLDRTSGTNTVNVTLFWDTLTSCTFDDADSLIVVSWDASQWKDLGNGGTTGNLNSGTIVSNTASTWYNVFALGTNDNFECLLCNEAEVLGDPDDCYEDEQMADTIMWYAFTPDSSLMLISVSHPSGGTLVGIDSIGVYGGSCSDQELLVQADISMDTTVRSFLSLVVSDLSIGTQYYIKLQGVKDTLFDLCLESINSAPKMGEGDCDDDQQSGTLITNGDFDNGNTGFTTNYQVSSGGPTMQPGFYRVTDNPINCNTNYFDMDDYPGGTTDNMLVVDGNTSGPSLVWQQTVPVDTNHCYCFSAWVANVSGGLSPNFTITFTGNNNGSISGNFGGVPSVTNDWVPMAMTYLAGNNSSVTIRIFLNTEQHAGNDFAIDHIEMFEGTQLTIVGPENSCAANQVYSIDPSVGAAFGWTVPSGATIVSGQLTESIEVDWGNNAFGSGGEICANLRCGQVCIDVPGCCWAGDMDAPHAISSETFSGGPTTLGINNNIIVSAGGVISGTDFAINGTFSVDADLTFNDCDIVMGEDAKIELDEGVTLTVTNGTWIRGCEIMWDYILVPDDAEIIVEQNSRIEDAETAIDVTGSGTYDLDNSTLSRNYTHLRVFSVEGMNHDPGDITSTTFTCPSWGLAAPRLGQQTEIAIDLQGGFAFDCGVATAGQRNTIERADFGIQSHGFTLFGISTGPSLDILNNDFNYLGWGVFSDIGNNVLVEDNIMKHISVAGVLIEHHVDRDIDIFDNVFSDDIGIGIWCFDNRLSDIHIDNNRADFGANDQNTGIGIGVFEVSPRSLAAVNIENNEIISSAGGIYCRNLIGVLDLATPTSSVYIGDNTVSFRRGETPSTAFSGILLHSCFRSVVSNNEVWQVNNDDDNYWETGIRQDGGNTNFLFCNNTHDIGRGIFISGDVRPFEMLALNQFSDNDAGGLFLNSGRIGTQGSPNRGNDNTWDVNTNWNATLPAAVNYADFPPNISGFDSRFHVQGAASTGGTPNPFNPPFGSSIIQGTFASTPIIFSGNANNGFGSTCPVFVAPRMLDTLYQMRDTIISFLNNTTLDTALIDTTQRWQMLYGLYQYLETNDTLKTSDTLIENFYDSCNASNMGELHRAMYQIADTAKLTLSLAQNYQDTLGNMTVDNHGELRIKEVLEIMYDNFVDDITLTSSQTEDLVDIAELCPLEEGMGVYMARSYLLEVDTISFYWNSCEASPEPPAPRLISPNANDDEQNMAFALYPNPNDGNMYLEYVGLIGDATFEMFDIAGRLVTKYQLPGEEGKINISEHKLESGLYTYRILNGDTVFKAGKVVIQK